jgi:tRNA nucleotidyltransferase/poly(A) polymerase
MTQFLISHLQFTAFYGLNQKNSTRTVELKNKLTVEVPFFDSLYTNASQRDLKANALYYSFKQKAIIDYFGGLKDLDQHVISGVGDNQQKNLAADPRRVLRAARLEMQYDMYLEPSLLQAIKDNASKVKTLPRNILFIEIQKTFLKGIGVASFNQLREYGVLNYLFPFLAEPKTQTAQISSHMLKSYLTACDITIARGGQANLAMFFAVLIKPFAKDSFAQALREAFEQKRQFNKMNIYSDCLDKLIAEKLNYLYIPVSLKKEIKLILELNFYIENKLSYASKDEKNFYRKYLLADQLHQFEIAALKEIRVAPGMADNGSGFFNKEKVTPQLKKGGGPKQKPQQVRFA